MKRRDFLKISAPLGLSPLLINGLPIKSFASPGMLSSFCPDIDERVLVVIHLNGANDGFNTLIPLAQYDTYANARPNIKIEQNQLTALDDSLADNNKMGIHPSFLPFLDLYQNEELAIIQGVGYPLTNKSHFKSQELMFKGGDGTPENFNLNQGWFANYFDSRYPKYSGVPFQDMPDPLGLLMGTHISTGFHTTKEHELYLRLTSAAPNAYYSQLTNITGIPLEEVPETDQGRVLQHVLNVESSTGLYADRIVQTFEAGTNSVSNYPDAQLGKQLKTVARLLSGGIKTKIFQCNMGGFDTHGSQVNAGSTTSGEHALLLSNLSQSVKTFQEDLKALGHDQRVVTVIFSEFGRKVIQNANYGTDHGTLNHMFVIGSSVNPGVFGQNVDLANLDSEGAPNNNQLQFDYRQVLGSVLQDWMGAPDDALNAINFGNYTIGKKLDLINDTMLVGEDCYLPPVYFDPPSIRLNSWLEGFYQLATANMHQHLLQEDRTPLRQPYHKAPFKYYGSEQLETLPGDFVDWMLIELRNGENIETIISKKAVYINTSGQLLTVEGEDLIQFTDLVEGTYYIVLYHRNHLPVVSSEPVSISGSNPITYTFTDSTAKGENTMKQLSNGTWVQIAGDLNRDGKIANNDLNRWKNNRSRVGGYLFQDADANSIINTSDHNLIKQNLGKTGFFEQ